ncbi:erythropoietin-like isoform X2 [Chiloscyllium punctatum]
MIPLRPLCDSRVMDRYIREAKDLLKAPCNRIFQFPNAIPLPNTGLNLRTWRSKSKRVKNEEIKAGLIMLSNATQTAKHFITNNSTVPLLDKIYRNTRTFIHLLQLMNVPGTGPGRQGKIGFHFVDKELDVFVVRTLHRKDFLFFRTGREAMPSDPAGWSEIATSISMNSTVQLNVKQCWQKVNDHPSMRVSATIISLLLNSNSTSATVPTS